MPTVNEDFLLHLLQACGSAAPLYPMRFARQENLERDKIDIGLDELRRRGLVQFTEWVKDAGQGYALTEAGRQALTTKRLPTGRAARLAELAANDPLNPYQRGEIVRSALLGHGRPYACWALLLVNLLFFADGAIYVWRHDLSVMDYLQGQCEIPGNPPVPVLYELGALWPPSTVPEGEMRRIWKPQLERILLFLFLHAGLLHLFMNMYFLITLGGVIEAMWGWARFLAIYFVAGIVSGCVIILISRLDSFGGPQPITVGASGPLCGMFAAMIVWFALNREHLPENLIQDWSRSLSLTLLLMIAINFVPNVSWQGHLGGAIGGLLAALLLHVQRFHLSRGIRWLALAGMPLIPAAFFIAVLWQAGWF